jgi:hypothetical protein
MEKKSGRKFLVFLNTAGKAEVKSTTVKSWPSASLPLWKNRLLKETALKQQKPGQQ